MVRSMTDTRLTIDSLAEQWFPCGPPLRLLRNQSFVGRPLLNIEVCKAFISPRDITLQTAIFAGVSWTSADLSPCAYRMYNNTTIQQYKQYNCQLSFMSIHCFGPIFHITELDAEDRLGHRSSFLPGNPSMLATPVGFPRLGLRGRGSQR